MRFIYFLFSISFLSASDDAVLFFQEYQNPKKEKTLDMYVAREKIGEVSFMSDPLNDLVEIHIKGTFCQIYALDLSNNIYDMRTNPDEQNLYFAGHFYVASSYTFLYKTCIHDVNYIRFLPSLKYRYFLQECLTFVDVLTRNIYDYLQRNPLKAVPIFCALPEVTESTEFVEMTEKKTLFCEDNVPAPSSDLSNDLSASDASPEKQVKKKLFYTHDEFPVVMNEDSTQIKEPDLPKCNPLRVKKFIAKKPKAKKARHFDIL